MFYIVVCPGVLARVMNLHKQDPTAKQVVESKPTLLRALFTVGLLCRHFDFDSQDFGEKRVSYLLPENYNSLNWFL